MNLEEYFARLHRLAEQQKQKNDLEKLKKDQNQADGCY